MRFSKADANRERRRSLRRRVRLEVTLAGSLDRSAHTEDLSTDGLFVVTDRLRAVGSRVRLKVNLRGRSEELVGTVCWVRALADDRAPPKETRGFGLKILSLSRRGRTAVAALVKGNTRR